MTIAIQQRFHFVELYTLIMPEYWPVALDAAVCPDNSRSGMTRGTWFADTPEGIVGVKQPSAVLSHLSTLAGWVGNIRSFVNWVVHWDYRSSGLPHSFFFFFSVSRAVCVLTPIQISYLASSSPSIGLTPSLSNLCGLQFNEIQFITPSSCEPGGNAPWLHSLRRADRQRSPLTHTLDSISLSLLLTTTLTWCLSYYRPFVFTPLQMLSLFTRHHL